ncbi:MAG: DNA helicase PcrA [Acidimicrobiia bacterium]
MTRPVEPLPPGPAEDAGLDAVEAPDEADAGANPLLVGLNDRQREAVLHTEGPLLIVAGAGSGKTRVLTHRIAHLIRDLGVSPWAVLAITFTNKAATEMRERVGALVGDRLGQTMWVCTFHSACVRILRKHAPLLGFATGFSIYDQSDAQRLTALCVRDLNLDPKKFGPRRVHSAISAAKNELVTPDRFAELASGYVDRAVAQVFGLYDRRLREANAMDFDDLLVRTVELLRDHEDVRREYAERFRYVLVDEYQDTNQAQYQLSRLWSAAARNLCVVGDGDQSIYAFRGADVRNILEFERDYPDAVVVNLEQNYRSTQEILEAANSVIAHNLQRRDKRLFTERRGGHRIQVYEAENEHDEAAFVATEIDRLVDDEGVRMGDVAVFYRTNAQARVLEEVLVRAGVPYKVVGGTRFYDRREIKDALAYLRLLVNPADEVSLRRIVNVPRRGIGDQTLSRLAAAAAAAGVPLGEMLARVDEVPDLKPRARAAVAGFVGIIEELGTELATGGLAAAIEATWESTGYAAELRAEASLESQGRLENLAELLTVAAEFAAEARASVDGDAGAPAPEEQLREFLEDVSLVSDADEVETGSSSVTLMTLHNAKGLEFPVVFVTGMEEGVFPHMRSLTEPDQLEEERRLAYVGITRAMDRLYLCHALNRSLFGGTSYNSPSRFLAELPAELVDRTGGAAEVRSWRRDRDRFREERGYARFRRDRMPAGGAATESSHDEIDYDAPRDSSLATIGRGTADDGADAVPVAAVEPGDKVRHPKFGSGVVLRVEGAGDKATATVAFESAGQKQLVLAWARLEHV